MPTIVAFLRAINVGGRFLKMADLAGHFMSLGLANVTTYINSGHMAAGRRSHILGSARDSRCQAQVLVVGPPGQRHKTPDPTRDTAPCPSR